MGDGRKKKGKKRREVDKYNVQNGTYSYVDAFNFPTFQIPNNI